jgi:hypothetical protein
MKATGHSTSRRPVPLGTMSSKYSYSYSSCLYLVEVLPAVCGVDEPWQQAAYRSVAGLVFTVAPFRLNAVTP